MVIPLPPIFHAARQQPPESLDMRQTTLVLSLLLAGLAGTATAADKVTVQLKWLVNLWLSKNSQRSTSRCSSSPLPPSAPCFAAR